MRKFLIVNADDFGLCASVNRGIIEAFQRGVVTSTTVMVNMPGFLHALGQMAKHPGLAVGLHLNLTYGSPVLTADRVPSLVGGDGRFVKEPAFVLKHGRLAEMRAELYAQAEILLAAGIRPSHIDTHHHLHQAEKVLDLVAGLAHELGVTIRCLDADATCARGLTPKARFVKYFGDTDGAGRLISIISSLQPGATEIPCHPGYDGPELHSLSTLNEIRERELRALTDPDVMEAVRSCQVVLSSYLDL